jgi:crotonobetainyl-CoA:carnitine CoA-transferase CaiB-like acyl-CoA transferase
MNTTTPLKGTRVLDLSKVLAGPLCTQYLGDMGAEVIKVEAYTHGDDTRLWPPFENGDGTIFLSVNRNKRSIALDLKSPEGRDIVHKLAKDADVVIESFGPGVAERLKVDYDTLKAINPAIVYCNISGYGNVGPMREGKGYDVVLQAFSGMLSITGEAGGAAVRSPYSPVDQATGLHGLVGIMAGLLQRATTGEGMKVEASLFDTAVGFLGYFLQGFWQRGTEPQRVGSGHESLCPYQVFETKDKPMILGVANDSLWVLFCKVAEQPELAVRDGFATNPERVNQREKTVEVVTEIMRERTRAQWLNDLGAAGVPCSPVHNLGELVTHPHTAASGMLFNYDDPTHGNLNGVSQPLKFNGERPIQSRPPPSLGEHTDEILLEIGMAQQEIDQLYAGGIIKGSKSTSEKS